MPTGQLKKSSWNDVAISKGCSTLSHVVD